MFIGPKNPLLNARIAYFVILRRSAKTWQPNLKSARNCLFALRFCKPQHYQFYDKSLMATKFNGRGKFPKCLGLAYNVTLPPTAAILATPLKHYLEIVLRHSVSNFSYSLASTAAKLVFTRCVK